MTAAHDGGARTPIHTDEGFVYPTGVMHLFSRKIVGWSIGHTMATDLAQKALDAAIRTCQPAWLKISRGGRIRGDVNTNGAVTGRCTHAHLCR